MAVKEHWISKAPTIFFCILAVAHRNLMKWPNSKSTSTVGMARGRLQPQRLPLLLSRRHSRLSSSSLTARVCISLFVSTPPYATDYQGRVINRGRRPSEKNGGRKKTRKRRKDVNMPRGWISINPKWRLKSRRMCQKVVRRLHVLRHFWLIRVDGCRLKH